MTEAKHLSKSNEQYTPLEITESVREVLGRIDLDPASSELANEERVKADYIYTKENGLETFEEDWFGRVFLNPPGGGQPLVNGVGIRSNPVLFWAKLMHEWEAGNVEAAIVLGFTIEVLQTTQGEPGAPMLLFPFCIPRRRLRFDMPREEKIFQLREKLQEAKTEKKREALRKELAKVKALDTPLVRGEAPPHGNVLVLVPPREEHHFGLDKEDFRWDAWGGPVTRKFQEFFSRLGYVRV